MRPPKVAIPEALANDRLLHGSNLDRLDFLVSKVSGYLAVNDLTGEAVPTERRLYATRDPDLAIFYASVRSVCRSAGLYRATGVMPIRDNDGAVTGWEYFLSNAGKDLIASSHNWDLPKRVYFTEPDGFRYDALSDEYYTTDCMTEIVGSTAVYHTDLSFNIFFLPSPDSDPRIHAYFERAEVLKESLF